MDQNLTQLRDQIDGIDQKLVELFKQRMAVSREVAAYKQEHGLPTLGAAGQGGQSGRGGSGRLYGVGVPFHHGGQPLLPEAVRRVRLSGL